jgi:hypothetical protein
LNEEGLNMTNYSARVEEYGFFVWRDVMRIAPSDFIRRMLTQRTRGAHAEE